MLKYNGTFKELKNRGFKRYHTFNNSGFEYSTKFAFGLTVHARSKQVYNCKTNQDMDILYDLIKDGLVVKDDSNE